MAESFRIIHNGALRKEKDFSFHDSKPAYFEQFSEKQAVLRLYFDHMLAVFRFDGVCSISIDTDTVDNWAGEGYCCRIQHSNLIKFNAGDYTTTCQSAVLEKLVDFNAYVHLDADALSRRSDSEKDKLSAASCRRQYRRHVGAGRV